MARNTKLEEESSACSGYAAKGRARSSFCVFLAGRETATQQNVMAGIFRPLTRPAFCIHGASL